MVRKKIDLTGQVFNKLTVIGEGEGKLQTSGQVSSSWICKCDCGNTVDVLITSLRLGRTKSCGCLSKEKVKERSTTHGMYHTRTYKIWSGMKRRCLNKNYDGYEKYGGRGITVCNRWLEFSNFLEDMGLAPEDLTLERVDNSKGYSPSNCIWATHTTQSRNRRVQKNNTSGVKGVSYDKKNNSYRASIGVNGRVIHLGRFKSLEDAKLARKEAEKTYWS